MDDARSESADGLGWLEDCLIKAIALDHTEARDLVTSLHGLRARLAAFCRPEQQLAATAPARA